MLAPMFKLIKNSTCLLNGKQQCDYSIFQIILIFMLKVDNNLVQDIIFSLIPNIKNHLICLITKKQFFKRVGLKPP